MAPVTKIQLGKQVVKISLLQLKSNVQLNIVSHMGSHKFWFHDTQLKCKLNTSYVQQCITTLCSTQIPGSRENHLRPVSSNTIQMEPQNSESARSLAVINAEIIQWAIGRSCNRYRSLEREAAVLRCNLSNRILWNIAVHCLEWGLYH